MSFIADLRRRLADTTGPVELERSTKQPAVSYRCTPCGVMFSTRLEAVDHEQLRHAGAMTCIRQPF